MYVIMSILAVLTMVAVDQLVKYWAITMLAPMGSILLVPGILRLTYVENRGAAFSILENQIWLFVVLALVILCAIVYVLYMGRIQTMTGKLALLIIAAGAIGNTIDRVIHHYVVDMIEVTFIHFPVFNIADMYVCVGVALFAIYYLFIHKDAEETEQK